MRNFKRTLALVLAVIMVVGTFATVSAAETKWYQEAVNYLESESIAVIGNTADEPLSRNEFVLWVAKIVTHQISDNAWNDEIARVQFTDVNDNHHKAAIAFAHTAHYIIGNGDGTFSPDKTVSLAEASAVIVRVMGYESKVTGLADKWEMNYMSVASQYCRAFDSTFYAETDTFNPDYELTKGEAAYILATIMNGINKNEANPITTADGIDLGAWFAASENDGIGVSSSTYYVAQMDRASDGTIGAEVHSYIKGTDADGNPIADNTNAPFYTNNLAMDSAIILMSADAKRAIVMAPSEFLKLVRVSLGLAAERDWKNEEAEINIFETVKLGTMVDIVLDNTNFVEDDGRLVASLTAKDSYKNVASFAVNTNSVVVNTVLMAGAGTKSYESVLDYAVASIGDAVDLFPALSSTYDASMATSWTNIGYNENKEITSATLNFKGVAYKYGTDIVVFDKYWNELEVDEAVVTLLNAAQGECYAVFNDTDADGLYETVYVAESYPFAYMEEANIPGGDSTVRNFMTSVSNGAVAGTATAKGNAIGSVVWNKEVADANNGTKTTDTFKLTDSATGKLQLVLCAANAHVPTANYGSYSGYSNGLFYYTVVDLASFYTGIIEEVRASANVDGYYIASIKCTDGENRTVYIPYEASKEVVLPVTVAGATADYTFNSTTWFTFLEDVKEAAITEGILNTNTVKDQDYLTWSSAWMAGKYVEFAIDESNEVLCILGTESKTENAGFVTKVEKTTTGGENGNTYNVTIAVKGTVDIDAYIEYLPTLTDRQFAESNTSNGIADRYHTTNANKALFTAVGGNYGVDVDGDGVLDTTEGYVVDDNGNKFIDIQVTKHADGIVGTVTTEVRAAASGIFDWENYKVYNKLFAGQLSDPNYTEDGRIDLGKDLIYVTIGKDAGELGYVLYNVYDEKEETGYLATAGSSYRTTEKHVVNGTEISSWYYPTKATVNVALEDSWNTVEGEVIISITEDKDSIVYSYDCDCTADHTDDCQVTGYTAEYDVVVGYKPYYDRVYNTTDKDYDYYETFEEVYTITGVTNSKKAVVDTAKTLMIPVYAGETGKESVQVICTTDAMIKEYEDAGFYVDEDGYVFQLITGKVIYKVDTDKKPVFEKEYDKKWKDQIDTTNATMDEDVRFEDIIVDDEKETTFVPYATATITEKPKTADGWFPGSYYLNIDGISYNVTTDTEVVIITPNKSLTVGFSIQNTTVGALVNAGETEFFVTDWNAAVAKNNVVAAIAILGTENLEVPTTSEVPVVDTTRLVYLDGTASAVVKHNEYDNLWYVISDKSAYLVPTGEEVGSIYRSYPTYAAAKNDIEIDLSVEGGKWYVIDKDNKIVSSTKVTDGVLNVLKGTITDIKADGTTIATMNGSKNVDITDYDTVYMYLDGDKNVLYKAGDSTSVTVIDGAAYAKLFTELEKAVKTASENYYGTFDAAGNLTKDGAVQKHERDELTDERLAYYADLLATAEKALSDAKAATLDTYFNGQFWGFANSPLYKYVQIAGTSYQQSKPQITFDYVMVGDTLVVFSDSFVLG